jgi:hypothetical protein
MTSFYVDCIFIAKRNPFGNEPLLHDLGMAEGPASAEKPFPIYYSMKWEIETSGRSGDCPTD